MRRFLAALLLATFWVAPPARANGRFPTANQLVRRPGSTQDYALRATFGLLLSNDGAKTWNWVCEQAIGYQSSKDPPVQYTSGGAIWVGTFTDAVRSTDGCQWDPIAAIPNKFVSDLTVRKDRPTTGLVLISPFADSDGATSFFDTRLFELTNDGTSGSQVHTFDPTLLGFGVETAGASLPGRVYVTAGRSSGYNHFPVLLVSDDDGKNFVERPIPTDPIAEVSVYIAGVDPTNGDRIYVRTLGSIPLEAGVNTNVPYNRLWVSEDAGITWKVIFTAEGMTLQPLLGFALSEDGSKVYVGGPLAGLNVASRTDFQFKKTADIALQCLAMFDGVLWACSSTKFALGTTTDDGQNFTSVLELQKIAGPRTCPAESTFNTISTEDGGHGCTTVWPPIRDLLRIERGPPPDAGTGSMGGGGCRCDSAPSPSSDDREVGFGAAFGVLLGVGGFLALRGNSRKPRA